MATVANFEGVVGDTVYLFFPLMTVGNPTIEGSVVSPHGAGAAFNCVGQADSHFVVYLDGYATEFLGAGVHNYFLGYRKPHNRTFVLLFTGTLTLKERDTCQRKT